MKREKMKITITLDMTKNIKWKWMQIVTNL